MAPDSYDGFQLIACVWFCTLDVYGLYCVLWSGCVWFWKPALTAMQLGVQHNANVVRINCKSHIQIDVRTCWYLFSFLPIPFSTPISTCSEHHASHMLTHTHTHKQPKT